MNRLSLVVVLGAILLGCATLPSAQTRLYPEAGFAMAAASAAACQQVGATRNWQLRIENDMETMSFTAASATYAYTISWRGAGDSTRTTLIIQDSSGAYAKRSIYDEFWAALEANF
jgi:hypothetical protein